MAKDAITKQLGEYFSGMTSFTRDELYTFFRRFDPDLKETTFRWRIHDLKKNKALVAISKGLFTLYFKPAFSPNPDKTLVKIFKRVEQEFPRLKFCVFNTQLLNEFMLHLPAKSFTILQVEKEALEPVYAFLKATKLGEVFIQPTGKEMERYVFESERAIVLLPLVSNRRCKK